MKTEYSTQKLLDLLKDFYNVTGQRAGLFDAAGNVLLEYPSACSALCTLVRESPEGRRRCRAWDSYGIEQVKKLGHSFDYRCHAGLIEVCAPILGDGGVVGFIIFGQIINSRNVEEQWQLVSSRCEGIIADREKLRTSFDKIKRIDPEYISAVTHILEACVGYIRLEQLMIASHAGLWDKIRDYVSRNLTEKIQLADIASALSVSVSTLCRCVRSNAGCTLNELVRSERMELAKRLLSSTQLPVMEVSCRVGIDDYNYFIRIFKRECGTSPTAWRRASGGAVT